MAVYVTYIPVMFDPHRGSGGVSDIPPKCPRFTKMTAMRKTADVISPSQVVSPSPSDCSLSQVAML
jgi:hypothetical protein